jgi:hypothetical protein
MNLIMSIPKCEVMHEQVLKDSSLWGMEDRAEPPEDWLAIAVRKTLLAWIGSAEPDPDIWTRIRQQVELLTPSADCKGETHHVSNWVGGQMVNWGCKLQRYDTAAVAGCPQVATCQ